MITRKRSLQIFLFGLMVHLIFGNVRSQDLASDEIMNLRLLSVPGYLSGFERAISGQSIDYYSCHPDVRTALIVRATTGSMTAEWESEPLPQDYPFAKATFLWIAGLGCNLGEKKFDLYINDQSCLTFTSTSQPNWSIRGTRDETLSFQTLMTDQYGDRFGYMFLELPTRELVPGQPLRLKVIGETAGSQAWVMVFQASLRPKITFLPELVILKNKNRRFQNVRIHVVNLNKPIRAHVYSKEQAIMTTFNFGFNTVTLPFEAVVREKPVEIYIEMREQLVVKKRLLLEPVRQFTVYLLPHSHLDIGYTHYQEDVLKMQFHHLEQAIAIAEQSQSLPKHEQFKWNAEQLWHVDEYLKRQDDVKQAKLLAAIRNGWIGLDGLYANLLTGLCRPEELLEALAPARHFSQEYDIPIEAAMISDIPGWSWGLIPVLAQSGIKYLSLGPNLGHRIGHVFDWADQPFYWVSPSGEEQVLCWVHGKGYSWFHTGLEYVFSGELDPDRVKFERILPYLEQLVQANYPYDVVGLRYSIGSDNGPPDVNLSESVHQWNERYESPRLVIATTAQLFHELEARYRDQLPRVRGDFTPYWEDGAASTARETAVNRAAAERLVQASALWTILDASHYPLERFGEAWRQVLLFSEHTWGAWNSISAPDDESVKHQWQWKQQRAENADGLARDLLADAFRSIAPKEPKIQAIDVFNTCSWARTDLVTLPASFNLAGDLIKNEAGEKVPSQRLSTGELAFLAENIPPLASMRFTIHPGKAFQKGKANVKGNQLSNETITLELDPSTGTISSLKIKNLAHDFVAHNALNGLNDYIYVAGRDPSNKKLIDQPVKIYPKEMGKLLVSVTIESAAPGCNKLSRELRLIHGIARIDIINGLDRPSIREPEGIHFGFPFNIPEGEVRLDLSWGVIRPEKDQLRGACKNWFTVQRWVDISNGQLGITWVPIDAPLMELGDIRADATICGWVRQLEPSQTIYSFAMNNYWETNYKADQPGVCQLRYSIIPHGRYDQAQVTRTAIECHQPLIPVPVSKDSHRSTSLFRIEPKDVIVTLLKPGRNGKTILLRLFNPTPDPRSARLIWGSLHPKEIYMSDPFERPLERLGNEIPMPGYGIRTIMLIND
ncbi:MAG: glycoside hydrolase [candidate division KSB1 bacterium]|nr:glycoside hydrolase [candidate division KSB1 bacterium]